MKIEEILTLIGGLSLFLLGMDSMGRGLESACGNKMKSIIKKLTSNRFVGVLVGMFVTAIIQSSSATTVMVVGFVSAGMMTLTQATWVIMGANIGTTVTGLLIALDVGFIAPFMAILGVFMMLFIKKPIINEIGKIFAGFGILFIGMDMMSSAMIPLRENQDFINLMTQFSNPLFGILAGMVFTAIIQSSSASVGILQALAISGVIKLDSAVFVLFGQNIGTCVTALLASISATRSAKRTTLIHLMFNISGTLLFTILCIVTPLVKFMESLTNDPALQIANMHTLFNISTTLLLLPFGKYLVKLTEKLLPEKKEKKEEIFKYLNRDMNIKIGNNSLHLENLKREIERMFAISLENIELSCDDIINKNKDNRDKIHSNEELIDKLNEGIIKHITANLNNEFNKSISNTYGAYLNISNNIERLSDHALNISELNDNLLDNKISYSPKVTDEIVKMKGICMNMFNIVFSKVEFEDCKTYENKIDEMTETFRNNMLNRLKRSVCTAEGSISYSTLLINFERIGDHLLNIAEEVQKITD